MTSPLYFIAHWLTSTRRGAVALKFLEALCFAFGFLVAGWCVYMIETRFMPVITEWRLLEITRTAGFYDIHGVYRKERGCELVGTDIVAVPKMPLAPRIAIHQIKPYDFPGAQAPIGYTTWGPWSVKVPAALDTHREQISSIEVIGVHRCHAFWLQQTIYGRIRIEDMP